MFQAAAGGTLFLDEVADLPLAMQVKLLRAIQEKSVRPVGASAEQPTDVRLLSATHKDLATEVSGGRFRNDLYYRINVIDLRVPSLRERMEDLPILAQSLLQRIGSLHGTNEIRLEASAITLLQQYHFPGNVRELENILERASALCDGSVITADDLQFPSTNRAAGQPDDSTVPAAPSDTAPATADAPHGSERDAYGDLEGYLDNIERQILTTALEDSRWNKTAAARLLGISFRSLRYRLKKLGLED